jgi:hypothetical protein
LARNTWCVVEKMRSIVKIMVTYVSVKRNEAKAVSTELFRSLPIVFNIVRLVLIPIRITIRNVLQTIRDAIGLSI